MLRWHWSMSTAQLGILVSSYAFFFSVVGRSKLLRDTSSNGKVEHFHWAVASMTPLTGSTFLLEEGILGTSCVVDGVRDESECR